MHYKILKRHMCTDSIVTQPEFRQERLTVDTLRISISDTANIFYLDVATTFL